MALVQQIQKSFYSNETGTSPPRRYDGVIDELPLWRVQWTELPGFQNVLNVWQPHYTNMFMKIVSGPKPWYFGHLHLPGGTENLGEERFYLDGREGREAPMTGVLMNVCDYVREDDGRLTIIVQGMEKFRVLEPVRHTPYSIAKVQLRPDVELIASHYETVSDELCSSSPEDGGGDDDDGGSNIGGSRHKQVWAISRAAAVSEALHWHPFEYRHVPLVKTVTPAGAVVTSVSPLSNYDGGADVVSSGRGADGDEDDVGEVARMVARDVVKEYQDVGLDGVEDDCEDEAWMAEFLSKGSNELDDRSIREREYRVWVELDKMIRLLIKATPYYQDGVPIPTQMVGLLPRRPPAPHESFPSDFTLKKFVETLVSRQDSSAPPMVGTATKSPFVHVDGEAYEDYPSLRRIQRLSFVVWTILDQIVVKKDATSADQATTGGTLSRQAILEMDSIDERLAAALSRLGQINGILGQIVVEDDY